jgi:hypothetical protein
MIVRVKGIKRVRSKGRIYYYDRQTGRRVTAPYGTPAFFEEINQVRNTERATKAAAIAPTKPVTWPAIRKLWVV